MKCQEGRHRLLRTRKSQNCSINSKMRLEECNHNNPRPLVVFVARRKKDVGRRFPSLIVTPSQRMA